MVAIPAAVASTGERRPVRSIPSTVIVPASGRATPDRSFTSVLFPLPFSPTMPTIRPDDRRMLAETTARVAP